MMVFEELIVEMDEDTAEKFKEAMTGDDNDVLLAVEKTIQRVVDFDEYDPGARLWVSA